MGIRWRISILVVQLAFLLGATTYVTGNPFTDEVWFFAGLLAVVVNPQLLEPYYPRPADVIGNSILFLFLFSVSEKEVASLGWNITAVTVVIFGALALLGTFSSQSERSSGFNFGRAARIISRFASAQVIYSLVFFLGLTGFDPLMGESFWVLAATWGLVIFLGTTNWQRIWMASSSGTTKGFVDTVIGPSIITVTSTKLPKQDTLVEVSSHSGSVSGVVIKRIFRRDDIWGQIHLSDSTFSERFLKDGSVDVVPSNEPANLIVGSVDAGSTDTSLAFIATRPLEIGQVVAVPLVDSPVHVLYQLVHAYIENTDIKGGAHLFEYAKAAQLGIYVSDGQYFKRHPWTPSAGSPIKADLNFIEPGNSPSGKDLAVLGKVIGTELPVNIDLEAASTGHVAMLGMTKMGKSTLAERLSLQLAATRRVTILDITGEWIGKKGFPKCDNSVDWTSAGVSVFEPEPGKVPAARAEEFLNFLMEKAEKEYQAGDPFPRTVIIDEAHQFIPEPAGLGFNAPGRDNSFKIGLLLMQIRKFGISVILISQRTAVVAKSALSQCENLIAFRNVDQTGLDYLEALAGGDVRPILPRLQQGEALVFGPAISSELPVAINVFQEEKTGAAAS